MAFHAFPAGSVWIDKSRFSGISRHGGFLSHSLFIRLILPRCRDREITPTVNKCYRDSEITPTVIVLTGIMGRSQVTLLRKTVVSDELKPMKSRHRDREITPTVYTELHREETEF